MKTSIIESEDIYMNFVKMHGLGNDFVFLTDDGGRDKDYTALAQVLCNRHTGVGGDGLIVALPSTIADVCMRIINADGSEAEMCGNGVRCFAKYVYEQGLTNKTEFTVETLAGIVKPELDVVDGIVETVTIDMGEPSFERHMIPVVGEETRPVKQEELIVDGTSYYITSMLMGVPHTMIFVEDLEAVNLRELGPKVEKHSAFPKGTNVNFVEIVDRTCIKVRTWERGAGATLACGTGSCASAVAAYLNGYTESTVDVVLYLGNLTIRYEVNGKVFMTGPAAISFTGNIDI